MGESAVHVLEVLNGRGHLTLTWDAADAAQVAATRAEVAQLKAAGYSFFLVDGTPADEVAAGNGELQCRRVDEPPGLESAPETGEAPTPRRRGRSPTSPRTVAVRPQAGG